MKKLFVSALLFSASVSNNTAIADTKAAERTRQLVEDATVTARNFTDDANMLYLHTNLAKAECVLIIPQYGRAALILGGAGGGVSELILMVMTLRGMDSLLDSSFKLGMDTSVAAGQIGVGAKAQTGDILAFARSKGMFAGISVDGSVITVRDDYNSAYYGLRLFNPRDHRIEQRFQSLPGAVA